MRLSVFPSDHGEAPRLPAVRRRRPTSGFENPIYRLLGYLPAQVAPHRPAAQEGVHQWLRVLRGVEGSPRGGALWQNGDDRVLLYLHPLILMVLTAYEPDGGGVLGRAGFRKLRLSAHHDVGQKIPVLRVTVGDEGYPRVL